MFQDRIQLLDAGNRQTQGGLRQESRPQTGRMFVIKAQGQQLITQIHDACHTMPRPGISAPGKSRVSMKSAFADRSNNASANAGQDWQDFRWTLKVAFPVSLGQSHGMHHLRPLSCLAACALALALSA